MFHLRCSRGLCVCVCVQSAMVSVLRSSLLALATLVAIASVARSQPIGCHFDVEPHSLPEWSSEPGRSDLANSYVDLIVKLRGALPQQRRLTMDVQFSYPSLQLLRPKVGAVVNTSASLLEFVLDASHRATLMDYRNFAATCPEAPFNTGAFCVPADSILSHARDSLSVASAMNAASSYSPPVGVSLGVETDPLGDPPKITFGLMTERQMDIALNESLVIMRQEFGEQAVQGIAVHSMASYNRPEFLNLTGQPVVLPSSRPCRAMWVWQDAYVRNANGLNATQLLDFCLAHAIDTILIESQTLVAESQWSTPFADAITVWRAHGIATEMLFGYAPWAYPAQHDTALAILGQANTFWGAHWNTNRTAFPPPSHCVPNVDNMQLYDSSSLSSSSGGSSAAATGSGSAMTSSTGLNAGTVGVAAPSLFVSLVVLLSSLVGLRRSS